MGIIKLTSDFVKPQPKSVDFELFSNQLTIGIPSQTHLNEKRVALTPKEVKELVDMGLEVYVESGSGQAAGFTDIEYSEAGSQIKYEHKAIFKTDIIITVAPLTLDEIGFLNPNQILVSTLNFFLLSAEYFNQLLSKKVIAIAYDFIRKESGLYPVVHSISEICGRVIALTASEYYAQKHGILLGDVLSQTPSKITFLGAGTVTESAAKIFLSLGTQITIFDESPNRLKEIQEKLNGQIRTSVFNLDGLSESVAQSDVVIAAIFSKTGRAPLLIPEDLVLKMKKEALLMDICIDQGGCAETSKPTTHQQPFFEKHGITHYAIPNITSAVPRTSSEMFGCYNLDWLRKLIKCGSVEQLIKTEKEIENGLYMYKGYLLNSKIGHKFKIPTSCPDDIFNNPISL